METHCHTLVSNHAHSTLAENINAAKKCGMEGLCLTNHGPGIPDGAHDWHFGTLRHIPPEVDGIAFFSGIEANIIDYDGSLCVSNELLSNLSWVIVSIHSPCLEPSTVENITNAYFRALENPFVNCIGHMGQKAYLADFEAIVKKARELDKVIEINNHSLNGVRAGAAVLCREIAELCKKNECKIAVSSDAHYCGAIGSYPKAIEMLMEIGFPEKLIINTDLEKFRNYLRSK